MTKEEMIEMAIQAGFEEHQAKFDTRFEPFAKLVAEHVYAKYLELPEPKQSGTISITTPIGYLCENAVGHKYFRWKKPSSTYKPIALYTTPPQRTWVGLSEQEHTELAIECGCLNADWVFYGAALERKIKEKKEI